MVRRFSFRNPGFVSALSRPSAASPGPGPAPSPPLTGLRGRWSAPAIVGLTNGQGISQWSDISGNNYHFTQGTLAFQPSYATGQLNGLPAVRMPGGAAQAFFFGNAGLFTGLTEGEAFILLKNDEYPVTGNDWGWWSMPFAVDNAAYSYLDGLVYDQFMSTSRSIYSPLNTLAQWHVYNVTSTSGEWTSRYNRLQQFTRSNTVNTAGAVQFGASGISNAYWKGYVEEIILYDHKLSDADREAVMTYFTTVYGVPEPPTAPFPTTGLRAWYAAHKMPNSDGDALAAFTDWSGNGLHMTQTTTSAKPVWKSNIVNGQPAILFDPAVTTRYFICPPNMLRGMTEGEVFLILQGVNQGSTYVGLWSFPHTSDNENYPWVDGNIYDGFMSTGRKSEGHPASPANWQNLWHTRNVISTASEYTSSYNATQFFTTASNTVNTSATNFMLGFSNATFPFSGYIAELILFDHKLSPSDRTAVRAYITSQYGL